MGRPVVHFEFWSPNPDRASAFCREVFDWNIRSIPEIDCPWSRRSPRAASAAAS
jgi:predicted enzyme related to lactoylglutathione lyase